ncbi:MAG: hypothetical protein M3Y13_05325 [Armatimonadota bacterium]|nr:hypothetical protein [Armatimonadota bacterium]
MTEPELVQQALANLPRPAPPSRLRRKVMAQVHFEVTEQQTWTWSRMEIDGWITERWEGARLPKEVVPAPIAHTGVCIIRTHRHQDDTGGTTIYQFTQTY